MIEHRSARRYRVVQWGTGNVGMRALRHIIEHPVMDLVGVHVHNPDKLGRDAGELCGLAPVGIAATNSIEDIIRATPDCVLYMPHVTGLDEICRLLERGCNIVTTRNDFHHPPSMDPAVRQRVEAACRRGSSSIHSSGSSPGFATEALPLVLTSIQRRLDRLSIIEYADLSSRASPEMLFEVMGFGQAPEKLKAALRQGSRASLAPTLQVVTDALNIPLTGFERISEVAVARIDTPIAAGVINAGTVAAQRHTICGMAGGKVVISRSLVWYATTDIVSEDDQPWDLRASGWRFLVAGDAPLDVTITFPVDAAEYGDMTPGLTANRPVNLVPLLCDAPPGIRTTADLPQVIARLG